MPIKARVQNPRMKAFRFVNTGGTHLKEANEIDLLVNVRIGLVTCNLLQIVMVPKKKLFKFLKNEK